MPRVIVIALVMLFTVSSISDDTGHIELHSRRGLDTGSATRAAPTKATPALAATGFQAATVEQPRMRSQRLRGLDLAVVAAAARGRKATLRRQGLPEGHDHGAPAAVKVKPAVAADVRLKERSTLVAVTADRPFAAGTRIDARVREAGRWSAWFELGADAAHGPDPGTVEARASRTGSDPLLATSARRVQLRVDTPQGKAPAGIRLTSIAAPVSAGDSRFAGPVSAAPSKLGPQARATGSTTVGQSAPGSAAGGKVPAAVSTPGGQGPAVLAAPVAAVSEPTIISRAEWGADEAWRNRDPNYTDNVRVGFVHHTASTNRYSREQAAAQVRAIYSYHTNSLGHSDIDYNYLVDRFGRLYEGRAGGMNRAVMGGHTAGFNAHSFAVVALGNFSSFMPAAAELAAMKNSIARLFAWRLGLAGVNPGSRQRLVSAGFIRATRYNRGAVATLPALTSHRNVNYTACPGNNLEAELPDIRRRAAAYSNLVLSAPSPPVPSFRQGERTSVGMSAYAMSPVAWRADILSPCSDAPVRTWTGRSAGGEISLRWDLRDSAGKVVLPARHHMRLTGATPDGRAVPATAGTITIEPAPGGAWGPCGNASRVNGVDPSETSVLWGRAVAPKSRNVVLTGYSDAGQAAFAANLAAGPLARALKAPLLITPTSGLPGSVSTEVRRRRAVHVLIVGSTEVVPDAVARAVAGIARVTRLSGPTPAATANAVAARMRQVSTTRPRPVAIDLGDPAAAIASAALAAASGAPVAIGTPGTRRAEPTAVARRIAMAFPGSPRSVMLLPAHTTLASSGVAVSIGVPVLFTDPRTPSPQLLAYLTGRPAIRSVHTTANDSFIDDAVLGVSSRLARGLPWPPGPLRTDPTMTAKRKLSRANASPEPVRAGRAVKVRAKVRAKFADGKWRLVPAGQPFDVQFRARGTKRYRIVASGRTTSGLASLPVKATRSGRWRVVVAGTASRSDYVRVRR